MSQRDNDHYLADFMLKHTKYYFYICFIIYIFAKNIFITILRGEYLLNNAYYRIETTTATSTSVTEIPLRGRSFTLTVKFKF